MSELLCNRWLFEDNTVVGAVIQVANYTTGALATGTTTVPADNTAPTSSEGTQFMSLAFVPKHANNKLKITVVACLSPSTGVTTYVTTSLFKSTSTAALASVMQTSHATSSMFIANFVHYMTAGTTDSLTFTVRSGPHTAGTLTFNGAGGAAVLGGVMASSITIEEIQA